MKALPRFLAALLLCLPLSATAQVNSGSNGSDGALNPTVDLVIDMADHPDGIYHYTFVNIPAGVTVSFTPNAGNTPVVWLVQNSVYIGGVVDVAAKSPTGSSGSLGGPGGHRGGVASGGGNPGGSGLGSGGGKGCIPGLGANGPGGSASFATLGGGGTQSGETYGNAYLLPLIGGSGGGGGFEYGGSGGGGAILIAASEEMLISGAVVANGAGAAGSYSTSGAGSGGGVRLFCRSLRGAGGVYANGGGGWYGGSAGSGRVRVDVLENAFSGTVSGNATFGYQPVILPPANQAVSLAIQSVGGVNVSPTPRGQLTFPDVIVPAAQQNPVSIVVGCTNIPLGTEVIVDVKPANGTTVRAVGLNNAGTQASSTATVQVAMPRGGGTIQAKAVSGIQLAANDDPNAEHRSIAKTGWTADGERFKAVEVTAGLGTASQLVYLTESGKRYPMAAR